MAEHREYEKATGNSRSKGRQLVKMPGETRHIKSSDSAKTIARKIRLDKAERRLKRLTNG